MQERRASVVERLAIHRLGIVQPILHREELCQRGEVLRPTGLTYGHRVGSRSHRIESRLSAEGEFKLLEVFVHVVQIHSPSLPHVVLLDQAANLLPADNLARAETPVRQL